MTDLPKIGSKDEKALRALLKPRRSAPKPKARHRFRTRQFVFSPVDDAVFSEALPEIYPTVLFIGHEPWRGEVPVYRSIPEGRHSRISEVIVPPENWSPQITQSKEVGYYHFTNLPMKPGLRFHPSNWDWGPKFYQRQWTCDFPTLSEGFVTATLARDAPKDDPSRAIVENAWRIIAKIATNRTKRGHPLGNELMGGDRVLMEEAKGGFTWVGHHALEWCAAAPRRMLNGHTRPCDDWAPPADPWYRALREKVLEKYGPALGETPTER
jgi:hypothetical protein